MGDLSQQAILVLQAQIELLRADLASTNERLSDRAKLSYSMLDREIKHKHYLQTELQSRREELVLFLYNMNHATPSEPTAERGGTRLHRPPGHLLLLIAEFVCSKKTLKEVFEPTVLDFREEYNEALAERRPWKARWVRARGYWSFFNAAGLASAVGVGKKVVKLWKLVG